MIFGRDIWGGPTACLRLLGLLSALAATTVPAQFRTLESAGLRVGASPTEPARDFHQAEAFLNWNLPWRRELGSWFVQLRLDSSAGWLGDPNNDSFVAGVGPTVLLSDKETPLSLEGGLSPTLLTRWHFDSKNFGGPVQFTSHAGLNVDVTEHFRISYRFQHMSNAGIFERNPGLNLHMLAFSYRF